MQIRGFWWDLRMKSWKWWKIQCHEQIKYAWNHAPYGGLYSFLHSEKGLLWKNPTVSHPQYHLAFSPNIFPNQVPRLCISRCLGQLQTVWRPKHLENLDGESSMAWNWDSWVTGIVFFWNPKKQTKTTKSYTSFFVHTRLFFTLNVFKRESVHDFKKLFLEKYK